MELWTDSWDSASKGDIEFSPTRQSDPKLKPVNIGYYSKEQYVTDGVININLVSDKEVKVASQTVEGLPANKASLDQQVLASHYPGRFKNTTYRNMTIDIEFQPRRQNRAPYVNTLCAAGLTCSFSDKSWHEKSWNDCHVHFVNAKARKNSLRISLESPGHPRYGYNQLQTRGKNAGLATTSLQSDVPLAYRTIENVLKPKSEHIKHWRILHIASNCQMVQSDRNSLVEELMEAGLVDSYGKCQHNTDYNGTSHPSPDPNQARQLIQEYAFVTAFENSYYPGYVTEKLWGPLELGALPLYLGAPNAKSLFPTKSFIDVNDFISHEYLIDYISRLIENRDEYESYHSLRNKPLKKELVEIWRFAHQVGHPTCISCLCSLSSSILQEKLVILIGCNVPSV